MTYDYSEDAGFLNLYILYWDQHRGIGANPNFWPLNTGVFYLPGYDSPRTRDMTFFVASEPLSIPYINVHQCTVELRARGNDPLECPDRVSIPGPLGCEASILPLHHAALLLYYYCII